MVREMTFSSVPLGLSHPITNTLPRTHQMSRRAVVVVVEGGREATRATGDGVLVFLTQLVWGILTVTLLISWGGLKTRYV